MSILRWFQLAIVMEQDPVGHAPVALPEDMAVLPKFANGTWAQMLPEHL